MSPLLIVVSLTFGLISASLGMSFFALTRARAVAQTAALRALDAHREQEAALTAVRHILDDLVTQVQEIRLHPPAAPAAAMQRANLNLSKRSQALRMHRRGESPQKIATALEISRQELDLLLKVHRIVMSNI